MTSVKKIKVALLALVAALVIAIPTSAFADDPAGKITIKDVDADTTHTYKVYQLFTGKYDTSHAISGTEFGADFDKSKITNIVEAIKAEGETRANAGKSADPDSADFDRFVAAKAILDDVEGDINATQLAKAIGQIVGDYKDVDQRNNRGDADLIAEMLLGVVKDPGRTVGEKTNDGTYEVAGLATGYYFINDTATDTKDDTLSKYMLVNLESESTPVEITAKRDVPTVDKKVSEDSKVGKTDEWGESATYEIGQAIPYYLKGTMPADYGNYKKYFYEFEDNMGKGLDLDQSTISVVVKNGQNEVTLTKDVDYKVVVTGSASADTGTKMVISFDEMKDVAAVSADSEIFVYYTCRLTDDCEKGLPGIKNDVVLRFNNNPNQSGKGEPTGETPKQYCVVFTFDTDITKKDANTGELLEGAEFKLYKKVDNADKWYAKDVNGKVFWADAADAEGVVVFDTTTVKGSFTITGLDVDDTYYLKETKVPAGYNAPNTDFSFTLKADLEAEDGSVAVIGYNKEFFGENPETIFNRLYIDGETPSREAAELGTVMNEANLGKVDQTITNSSSTPLPSTGGIGTTIFYIVGAALILAAAITLVVRRRNATTA